MARTFYGAPDEKLTTVGITGTNGKTTTALLLAAACDAAGRPAGVIGTLGTGSGGRFRPAAEAPEAEAYSAEDEALLDRIAAATVRWGMAVPAIFMLESSKPLSFVGSQFLHFLSPIVHTVLDARELDRLAVMLERRETVEELIRRIERAENEGRAAGRG